MTHFDTISLLHEEARARAGMLTVTAYDVDLDLAADEATFGSVTTVRFSSTGGDTFVDIHPEKVRSIQLNGSEISPDLLSRGRLPISTRAGGNELVVDAVMRFRNDGEGLHRSVDPADGRHYVYGMCFMAAAPSIFACFDQPDLKAPLTLHVRAPEDWVVRGNAPGRKVDTGQWEFDESPPLSTYFVTLIAGPWHVVSDEHDGIPLALTCRASIAAHLDKDADELLTGTKQCFDEFHRMFGIRYPFGDYVQAFVPEFNAGAMENPGLVTFRDPMVFSSKVPRLARIQRMTTIAHEMAHQWFGDLVTPVWWDDLWLNESFAEYMGNRVTADVTEFGDAWVMNAYSRRQWGLTADSGPSTHPVAGNGAADAATALQNFDGISYAKGSAVLKQLNARLGDDIFLRGVVDHFERHRFGNATMHDLFGSWERAAGVDLSDFTDNWLRTAGPDTLVLDRDHSVVRRVTPAGHPAVRNHGTRVAHAVPGGDWQHADLLVDADQVSVDVAADSAVLVDPYDETWAITPPDQESAVRLAEVLPRTTDQLLRAGAWNGLQSAFREALLTPATVLDVAVATVPTETRDDALRAVFNWAGAWWIPLAADPETAAAVLHAAAQTRWETAEPGSTVQLTALHGAISTARDADVLRRWLEGGLPDGADLDTDLRWRLLTRLACLGGTDREELARHLADEPSAEATVAHVEARASLPDAEAKAEAWAYFTGETDAANYDIGAAGDGLWRRGQEALTDPYLDRFFTELPATTGVRSGWLLSEAARAFFPSQSLSPAALTAARCLLDLADLHPVLRRVAVDRTDELARRHAVSDRFGWSR